MGAQWHQEVWLPVNITLFPIVCDNHGLAYGWFKIDHGLVGKQNRGPLNRMELRYSKIDFTSWFQFGLAPAPLMISRRRHSLVSDRTYLVVVHSPLHPQGVDFESFCLVSCVVVAVLVVVDDDRPADAYLVLGTTGRSSS